MSQQLGLMAYERPYNPFLKGEQWLPAEKDHSDQMARDIDGEVRAILERSHDRARALLVERRGLLEAVASRLLS